MASKSLGNIVVSLKIWDFFLSFFSFSWSLLLVWPFTQYSAVTCHIWRPVRCKHCRMCQICVDGYDHHYILFLLLALLPLSIFVALNLTLKYVCGWATALEKGIISSLLGLCGPPVCSLSFWLVLLLHMYVYFSSLFYVDSLLVFIDSCGAPADSSTNVLWCLLGCLSRSSTPVSVLRICNDLKSSHRNMIPALVLLLYCVAAAIPLCMLSCDHLK